LGLYCFYTTIYFAGRFSNAGARMAIIFLEIIIFLGHSKEFILLVFIEICRVITVPVPKISVFQKKATLSRPKKLRTVNKRIL
jgi:hypothetical protein